MYVLTGKFETFSFKLSKWQKAKCHRMANCDLIRAIVTSKMPKHEAEVWKTHRKENGASSTAKACISS